MIHRHLEVPAAAGLDELPVAAIVDILERGDLADWRPLANAVASDPFGALAERIARILDENPMYGTSALWRSFLDRCRVRHDARERAQPSAWLAELRRQAELTQVELADRMGMSQSDLSKLERRPDLRLSTLQRYVSALGARLRIHVGIGAHQVELQPPGIPPPSADPTE